MLQNDLVGLTLKWKSGVDLLDACMADLLWGAGLLGQRDSGRMGRASRVKPRNWGGEICARD